MVADDEVESGIAALVEDLRRCSGHDFRQYARGSRRRRIEALLVAERIPDVEALRARMRNEPAFVQQVLQALSIPATAMFRDPAVYRAIRERVVPHLATFPVVRVWLAGCATGEEAWSLAVLLHEEGLYERSRLYATDMNSVALARAADGIFPLSSMRDYTRNYQESGGIRDFSGYYTAAYDAAKFDVALKRNLVFAQHNLVVDRSFNEFHLILCRNVMIYFDDDLQARVHGLLHDSLAHLGVLCLGASESLYTNPPGNHYQPIDAALRLYRKVARIAAEDGDPQ